MTLQIDDDWHDAIDYSTLSNAEIYDRLLHRWFSFFRQNEVFESYCASKRAGDAGATECVEREAKHPCIAELYEDWGDIHALPTIAENSDAWHEWLASKRRLFFGEGIPSDGAIGDEPKYRIAAIKSQTNLKLLNRLDRADLVHDLLDGSIDYSDPDRPLDFEYSHREIAALVLKIPAIARDFGWHPSDDLVGLLNAGAENIAQLDSCKQTILEADAFYWACVEGTINGVFPSVIPSDRSDRQYTKRSR
ncbi:hypothetical protein GXB81_18130 [Paraburkholderia sp. Ac-20336]|uniref:hypothetical protein n=1 Tax=Paraburkholderia sp. Ac-20336 TaxID=2703886 RepID=UPI00197ECF74|nr:hypothetical protein [Paraburkholderia sp. Ac-20336]MBN3804954.1 hypothetical protein [Paraburkholderia sp. Ac-20336]